MEEILKDVLKDQEILDKDYKDLKATEEGKEKLNKYVERWTNLGFTQGFEGETEERCAFAMEQLAIYLLTENEEYKHFDRCFETIAFPMVRRVIAPPVGIGNLPQLNDPDLFDFRKFIDYCKELNLVKLIEEVNCELADSEIDVELETLALACNVIIMKFNDEEKTFKELVEELKTNLIKQKG